MSVKKRRIECTPHVPRPVVALTLDKAEEMLDTYFNEKRFLMGFSYETQCIYRTIHESKSKEDIETVMRICRKFVYLQIFPVPFDKDVWSAF